MARRGSQEAVWDDQVNEGIEDFYATNGSSEGLDLSSSWVSEHDVFTWQEYLDRRSAERTVSGNKNGFKRIRLTDDVAEFLYTDPFGDQLSKQDLEAAVHHFEWVANGTTPGVVAEQMGVGFQMLEGTYVAPGDFSVEEWLESMEATEVFRDELDHDTDFDTAVRVNDGSMAPWYEREARDQIARFHEDKEGVSKEDHVAPGVSLAGLRYEISTRDEEAHMACEIKRGELASRKGNGFKRVADVGIVTTEDTNAELPAVGQFSEPADDLPPLTNHEQKWEDKRLAKLREQEKQLEFEKEQLENIDFGLGSKEFVLPEVAERLGWPQYKRKVRFLLYDIEQELKNIVPHAGEIFARAAAADKDPDGSIKHAGLAKEYDEVRNALRILSQRDKLVRRYLHELDKLGVTYSAYGYSETYREEDIDVAQVGSAIERFNFEFYGWLSPKYLNLDPDELKATLYSQSKVTANDVKVGNISRDNGQNYKDTIRPPVQLDSKRTAEPLSNHNHTLALQPPTQAQRRAVRGSTNHQDSMPIAIGGAPAKPSPFRNS